MTGVAVVVPAYNAEAHLADALHSALNQTHPAREIIVIDDGSTDRTATIAREFGENLTVISQSNHGVSASRNLGILRSCSEFVAFLDADDLWHPRKLELQMAALAKHSDAPFVFNDIVPFADSPPFSDPAGTEAHAMRVDLFPELFRHNSVHCSSVLARREALAHAGLFDVDQRGAEDMDLWLRLSVLAAPVKTKAVLSGLRQHPQRTTKSIRFVHEKLKAFEMMMLRWKSEADCVVELQVLARNDSEFLAYAYAESGDFAAAKELFLKTARWGKKPIKNRLKAVQMHFKRSARGQQI
ncbi:MAG: glycosyltransferase family 2 protein [Pseudomonadota bacterium]